MDVKASKHGYQGACSPGKTQYHCHTFSVGIFEWIPKKRGGVKPGPVKIRVRGYSAEPKVVYRLADIFVSMLDRGEDPGCKKVYASDMKWVEFAREYERKEG